MPTTTADCPSCKQSLPLHAFGTRSNRGRKYRRSSCKECEADAFRARYAASPDFRQERSRRNADYNVENKGALYNRAKERRAAVDPLIVLSDMRRSDRRRGWVCTLVLSDVQTILGSSCSYCGETGLRMTADRVDNSIGHTPQNVVPACIRCNYARRDMPYEAWLLIAPAMKVARDSGLFGDWTGGARKSDKSKLAVK